jgi:hypothetical protein
MSLLAPEVHAALGQLLQGLSSSDNETRSQAEERLNAEWVAAQPDVLLMGLVEQMQQSADPTVWHARTCANCPRVGAKISEL